MIRKALIFVGGIALGGVVAFFIVNGGKEAPSPQPESPKKPSWMAAPQPEKKVKKEERERALKVGVIGPETGENADYGLSVLEGIRLGVKHINAGGGLGGKKIEIVHYDNSGGPAQARSITSDLITQNVAAIFSAPTGSSTFAPTQLINASDTIFISIGTRRKIGRSGKYIFQFSLSDEIAIEDMLKYSVNNLGYRNYALVTSSSYDYSLSISSVFKQAISKSGGQIVAEADTYNTYTGKRDLQGVVTSLKDAPKEMHALIFTGEAEEAALLARAMKDSGVSLPLVGGEDLFSEKFLNLGGETVRGTLFYTAFSPDDDFPLTVQFVKNYLERRNLRPNRFAALAFDAIIQFTEALKKADSLKSSDIRNAMLNTGKIKGITGSSHWSKSGEQIKKPFFYRAEGDQSGMKFVLLRP
ncbi:MAG TPA: ABC transporter substrate-binding protein [Rhodospirillales bacterium]|nr:ABC transporter substrate-binding protein [Rhodospirillales bacterium]